MFGRCPVGGGGPTAHAPPIGDRPPPPSVVAPLGRPAAFVRGERWGWSLGVLLSCLTCTGLGTVPLRRILVTAPCVTVFHFDGYPFHNQWTKSLSWCLFLFFCICTGTGRLHSWNEGEKTRTQKEKRSSVSMARLSRKFLEKTLIPVAVVAFLLVFIGTQMAQQKPSLTLIHWWYGDVQQEGQ